MADHETQSIPALVRSILDDVRDLIRGELALAKAEMREEISAVQTVSMAFGAAAVAAVIGAVLLCVAIGGAIAYFLAWPTWIGYLLVAILLFIAAAGAAMYGRGRLARVRGLPTTRETLKENLSWMQSKSPQK